MDKPKFTPTDKVYRFSPSKGKIQQYIVYGVIRMQNAWHYQLMPAGTYQITKFDQERRMTTVRNLRLVEEAMLAQNQAELLCRMSISSEDHCPGCTCNMFNPY